MGTTTVAVTEAQIKKLAKAQFDAWNAHDVDALVALMTDDVVYEDPSFEKPAVGKEEVAARLRGNFTAFPDIHFPEELFHVHTNVKDAEYVVTWTYTATMLEALDTPEGRMPATGKQVTVTGASLNHFRDGKVSRFSMYYDSLDVMQQLGFLPETTGLGFRAVMLGEFLAGKAKKVLHMA